MSRKMRYFWVAFIALNLIMPAAAMGKPKSASLPMPELKSNLSDQASAEPVEEPAFNGLDDLMLEELGQTFYEFKPGVRGSDPNSTAFIEGYVFESCARHFEIGTAQTGKTAGFQIRDVDGLGRSCVAKIKAEQKNKRLIPGCGKVYKCIPLNRVAGQAEFPLKNLKGTTTLGLLHEDQYERLTAEAFEGSLVHKDQATLNAEAEARRRAKYEAEVELFKNQLSGCRGSLDHLPIAYKAAKELFARGELEDLAATRQELDRAQIKLLGTKAAKTPADSALRSDLLAFASDHPDSLGDVVNIYAKIAKSVKMDELDAIREELISLNSSDSEHADKIASVLKQVAQRYTSDDNADLAQYRTAAEIMKEAADLDGLSDSKKREFRTDQRDLSIAQLELLAIGDDQFSYALEYQRMYQSVAKDYQKACGGRRPNPDSCASASKAFNTVNYDIPWVAKNMAEERSQRQQRMQQMLMASRNPSQANSSPNPAMPPQQGFQQSQPLYWGGGTFGMPGTSNGLPGFQGTRPF
ncbi:MAG: hypothetical protein A2428_11500 [Bdellovibrionales bacterium RIFOXYC1_FULL_54_43]|nr:MAG: hypothetical protein A2428_11500 [Bdellovibrionales bacterium RIFOXYC1_FULL_54_43]OFZ80180.1 MAG: hypothetical protein A2603_11345 [Bdellovibrionales bacterium RIFOXYD1_FULL_55_31]